MAQRPYSVSTNQAQGLTQVEAISVAFSVGWMIVIGLFFWLVPALSAFSESVAGLRIVLMLIAVFMPPALIWVAVGSARSTRLVLAENARLRSDLDAMWQVCLALQAIIPQTGQATSAPQDQAASSANSAPTGFTSRREVSRLIVPRAAPQPSSDQPALALDEPREDSNPPLERPDLIQALNFPDDEHDTEGFAALRRALRDRIARRLVQASQDVLTLLSQDGIYMDDLHPEPISADLWRRFSAGERGNTLDRLGAVRDELPLRLVVGRMREDTIFRDAVHHFLRRFDQMLVTFEEHATDTDLLELAETRTARAFMLLGRATGTFD